VNSLRQLTTKEYAEKTAEGFSKLSGYNSWVWTGKGLTVTLLSMYYSELGKSTLKIEMGWTGKPVSTFFIGNSRDILAIQHLWVSFWDTTLPKS
jgi:hypothetical protein